MKTLCLLLIAAALAAPAGVAQTSGKKNQQNSTRTVQGTVTNAENGIVTGAVVQLKNLKTLQIRSYITQQDGIYHFNELSPDIDYELRADDKATGTSSKTHTLSSFDSRKEARIDLKLQKK